MKNSKLLNKKNLSIILFFLFFGFSSFSQEPADIWNIENENTKEKTDLDTIEISQEKNVSQSTIYEMQNQKTDLTNIELDQTLVSKEIEIVGLYDPAEMD